MTVRSPKETKAKAHTGCSTEPPTPLTTGQGLVHVLLPFKSCNTRMR